MAEELSSFSKGVELFQFPVIQWSQSLRLQAVQLLCTCFVEQVHFGNSDIRYGVGIDLHSACTEGRLSSNDSFQVS